MEIDSKLVYSTVYNLFIYKKMYRFLHSILCLAFLCTLDRMIQGEFPIGTSGKDPARQQEKIGITFQRT